MRHQITGFVLAGGKSSRMGTNKAFLTLSGHTLIERAKAVVETVCAPVVIVGRRELYGELGEVCEDIFPGCGPLGGIHAALAYSHTGLNLITAVDMPFLTRELLGALMERAMGSAAVVTVPRIAGHTQPLCGVYSREFLPLAEAALAAGNYKLERVFPKDRTLVVDETALAGWETGEPSSLLEKFANVNTPDDFQRAREFAGEAASRPREKSQP